MQDLNSSILKERIKRCPSNDKEDILIRYNFHKISSYSNTKSTGTVLHDISRADIENKNILIIEDIYDGGTTMLEILNLLKEYKAASYKVVCLLHKKNV